MVQLPLINQEGELYIEPIAVLDRRIVPRNNQAVTQVLIQWSQMPVKEATWEDWSIINSHFLDFFNPWGQGFCNEGGIVMTQLEKKQRQLEF